MHWRAACGTLDRTSVALQRTGGALERTGGAKDRTGVASQRTGDPPDRTGGAIERSRHTVHTCSPFEPAAAQTAGPLMSSLWSLPPHILRGH